jgi:hypothetical protein
LTQVAIKRDQKNLDRVAKAILHHLEKAKITDDKIICSLAISYNYLQLYNIGIALKSTC